MHLEPGDNNKMVGFQSKYYINLPDEYTISHGTLLIKSHHEIKCSQGFKVGDKLIVLPKWDGRNYATFQEMMELHEQGEIGEVIELREPYLILSGDPADKGRHYKTIVIKKPSGEMRCAPQCYLLGYKLKKLEESKKKKTKNK